MYLQDQQEGKFGHRFPNNEASTLEAEPAVKPHLFIYSRMSSKSTWRIQH